MAAVYIALLLISAATLALQVVLTRFFALAQGSHLAFMAVSLALLGSGASGTYLSLRRVDPAGLRRLVGQGAILFSLAVPAAYLAINYLPFDAYRLAWEPVQWLWLTLYYLALTVPFFFSGLVIGAALAATPGRAGPPYAAHLLGSALGPHPYPSMVREFQAVIGREARQQILLQAGRLPDACVACVGGGSNAIGLFHAFVPDTQVRLIGVEAGGLGIASGKHAARLSDPQRGRPGVLQGTYTYVLQDEDGQIALTHSISAGLDYAAIGPEHAFLRLAGRAEYTYAEDQQALSAFQTLARTEGILPALESSHAVAEAIRLAPALSPEQILIVNLSGRGDKDLETIVSALGR